MPRLTTVHFQALVKEYYAEAGRHDLPWRQPQLDGEYDPYAILVSEIMLQQTSVSRVRLKFADFMAYFPTIDRLAAANQGDVMKLWSGLGYNRRAKFLHQTAQIVVQSYSGSLPKDSKSLTSLPGIGINTAGAVVAYAFNKPTVFVETNIRTVFLHHYFTDQSAVTDADIREQVQATLDYRHPRLWYWALMDYGRFLKQTIPRAHAKRSASYAKQPPFIGSLRQIRGEVIRVLTAGSQSVERLQQIIPDERLPVVLGDLEREGLIYKDTDSYYL